MLTLTPLTPLQKEVARILASWPPAVEAHLPEATADQLGVTRRSVENALRRLEDHGAIRWHRKGPGGIRRPFYLVTVVDADRLNLLAASVTA